MYLFLGKLTSVMRTTLAKSLLEQFFAAGKCQYQARQHIFKVTVFYICMNVMNEC